MLPLSYASDPGSPWVFRPGSLCVAKHHLGFWYVHLLLSTKLLSNHPSPPRCSHPVIPESPSNYWGIISVRLLMCVCDPVTCEIQHYLPGFPRESKNSLTTETDAFYLFCLPSCLLHYYAQLNSGRTFRPHRQSQRGPEEVGSILKPRRAVQSLRIGWPSMWRDRKTCWLTYKLLGSLFFETHPRCPYFITSFPKTPFPGHQAPVIELALIFKLAPSEENNGGER